MQICNLVHHEMAQLVHVLAYEGENEIIIFF